MTAPLTPTGGLLDGDVAVDLAGFFAELSEIERRALRLQPVFAGAVDRLVTAFLRKRFDTEGAYLGTKWAPLAKRTLSARKRPGRGRGGILRDTNALWGTLVKSGGPGSIREVTDALYRRGTADPKAAVHQHGAEIKRRAVLRNAKRIAARRARGGRLGAALGARYLIRIPARPIIPDPVPPALVAQITTAIRDWLAKAAA